MNDNSCVLWSLNSFHNQSIPFFGGALYSLWDLHCTVGEMPCVPQKHWLSCTPVSCLSPSWNSWRSNPPRALGFWFLRLNQVERWTCAENQLPSSEVTDFPFSFTCGCISSASSAPSALAGSTATTTAFVVLLLSATLTTPLATYFVQWGLRSIRLRAGAG